MLIEGTAYLAFHWLRLSSPFVINSHFFAQVSVTHMYPISPNINLTQCFPIFFLN